MDAWICLRISCLPTAFHVLLPSISSVIWVSAESFCGREKQIFIVRNSDEQEYMKYTDASNRKSYMNNCTILIFYEFLSHYMYIRCYIFNSFSLKSDLK